MGQKTVSSINGAGKTGPLHVKRMKLEHFLTPYTKINSKWIKYLNVRPENIGRTLNNINQSKILYDPPPRVMEIKTNINGTWLNLKAFAQQRKLKARWKDNSQNGKKTIANETNDKGLISKIYKQFIQLNIRKAKTQSKSGKKT